MSQGKVRNYSLDFWRFLATIGIALCHFNQFGLTSKTPWMTELGMSATKGNCPPVFFGGLILEFFLIMGGYFMVATFKSQQRKGISCSPGTLAWRYTAGRYKVFAPILFFGYMFTLVFTCIYEGFSLREWFYALSINTQELLGLGQLGFVATTTEAGLAVGAASGMNQSLFGTVSFVTPWASNYPLWYLSALIVMSPIIYYLLAHDEDKFKGFWCPLIILLWASTFAFSGVNWLFMRSDMVSIGIPINVMWVTGGTCMGALTYYFVEFLKKKGITDGGRRFLTGLNIVCSVWMLYAVISNTYMWMGPEGDNGMYVFNCYIYLVPIMGILISCFLNEDALSHLLNRPIFGRLGEFMLYWFSMHHPMTKIVPWALPGLRSSYIGMLIAFLLATTVCAFIMEFLCKKVAMPLLAKVLDAPKPPVQETQSQVPMA